MNACSSHVHCKHNLLANDGRRLQAIKVLSMCTGAEVSGNDLCATNGDGLTTTYAGNWTLFYNESRPNSLPAFLALLDGASLLGSMVLGALTTSLPSNVERRSVLFNYFHFLFRIDDDIPIQC